MKMLYLRKYFLKVDSSHEAFGRSVCACRKSRFSFILTEIRFWKVQEPYFKLSKTNVLCLELHLSTLLELKWVPYLDDLNGLHWF